MFLLCKHARLRQAEIYKTNALFLQLEYQLSIFKKMNNKIAKKKSFQKLNFYGQLCSV